MADLVLLGDPVVAAVPVVDSGEDMVDLRDVDGLALDRRTATVNSAYALLRRGVAHRLLEAQAYLPSTYRLLVVEGYRPAHLQERYFADYQRELERVVPALDAHGRHRLASRHVSPPMVAPHVSGAAVDVCLADGSGRPLDMGTVAQAAPDGTAGASYFTADNISDEAKYHRQLLGAAMLRAEFVNYPTEWWHWSYGDRYWAMTKNRPCAIYGAVDPEPSSLPPVSVAPSHRRDATTARE